MIAEAKAASRTQETMTSTSVVPVRRDEMDEVDEMRLRFMTDSQSDLPDWTSCQRRKTRSARRSEEGVLLSVSDA